ncbi:MAG: cobalamin-dependent protein [Thermodesulfobacteriota bacterium]|nr:cobalamin-dependent protein [Thermodesulfobacteriota bacterium]
MPRNLKNVLLLYTDKYYLIKQVYPFGLDLVANHLRRHHFNVTIDYPFLPLPDIETNLIETIKRCQPDAIGLGIRNIDTAMSCEKFGNLEGSGYKTFYFLHDIKKIVEIIRKVSPHIPIVAGGGAFTVSAEAILEFLEMEYGIIGEGENSLVQFLKAYPDKKKIHKIPNMVFKVSPGFQVNRRQTYVFNKNSFLNKRNSKFNYAHETHGLPVTIKRGCNQHCSYCVEPMIEGTKFIFRNHGDIIAELNTILENYTSIKNIFFTDTEFNLPDLTDCSHLVKKILEAGLHNYLRFSSQFLPKPFDENFAKLLAETGFSVILTCDSFADSVLSKNRTSYRQKDITGTIELCEKFNIDCTVNLVFGLPGESYKTMDHTVGEMVKYPPNAIRRYEYTIGGRIYQGTPLSRLVEQLGHDEHLYGEKSKGYLQPYYYCSPDSPPIIKNYLERFLPFSIDYQNNYDNNRFETLACAYLADQSRWDEAAASFLAGSLSSQIAIYGYLFRKFADFGKPELARSISRHLIDAIHQSENVAEYEDQIAVIRYYLSMLAD